MAGALLNQRAAAVADSGWGHANVNTTKRDTPLFEQRIARRRAVQPEHYSAGRRARGRTGATARELIWTTHSPPNGFGSAARACCICICFGSCRGMHLRVLHSGVEWRTVWPEVLHASSSRPFRRDPRWLAPVFAHHVYNGSQPPRTAPVSERRCRSARPITTRAQRKGPSESDYGIERRPRRKALFSSPRRLFRACQPLAEQMPQRRLDIYAWPPTDSFRKLAAFLRQQ
jgi:hypothetical protein